MKDRLQNPEQSIETCIHCSKISFRTKQLALQYQHLVRTKQQQLTSSYQVIRNLQMAFGKLEKQTTLELGKLSQENQHLIEQLTCQTNDVMYLKSREVELMDRIEKLQNTLFLSHQIEPTVVNSSNMTSRRSLNTIANSNSCQNLDFFRNNNTKHSSSQPPVSIKRQALRQLQVKDVNCLNRRLQQQIMNLKDQNDILQLKERIALMKAMEFAVLTPVKRH